MTNCYLCGKSPANHTLKLKDTFTAHSLAKSPSSDKMCDRCEYSVNLIAYYWNENKVGKGKKEKGNWSKIYSRNWSWLYQGEKLIAPIFDGEKDGIPVVSKLPTRELIREWLINPPTPPFTIAIAESGQKHILFLALEAQSRDVFPVQFELDTLYIKRKEFCLLLENYEALMLLGATKTEITSGQYKSQFLLANLSIYQEYDDVILPYRGSRLLELIEYVAIKQEKEIKTKEEKQLNLF